MRKHRRALFEDFVPKGPFQKFLVNKIADLTWKFENVPLCQAQLLAAHVAATELDLAAQLPSDEIPEPGELAVASIVTELLKDLTTIDQAELVRRYVCSVADSRGDGTNTESSD